MLPLIKKKKKMKCIHQNEDLAVVADLEDVASQSQTENLAGNLERELCSPTIDFDLKDTMK